MVEGERGDGGEGACCHPTDVSDGFEEEAAVDVVNFLGADRTEPLHARRLPSEDLDETHRLVNKGGWETQFNENDMSNFVQLFDSFNDPEAGKILIKTTYNYDNDKSVTIIEYTFEAPENNIEEEKRSLRALR